MLTPGRENMRRKEPPTEYESFCDFVYEKLLQGLYPISREDAYNSIQVTMRCLEREFLDKGLEKTMRLIVFRKNTKKIAQVHFKNE